MASLHFSGLVVLALDNFASRLAALASEVPDCEMRFREIREAVLRDLKNSDVSGTSMGAEVAAMNRALEHVAQVIDGTFLNNLPPR